VINTSKRTLIIFAASVWATGSFFLFRKGYYLLREAYDISSSTFDLTVILIIILTVGLIKSKCIMIKFCRKNIKRIDNLFEPKIHQFFEPKFFFLLLLMILSGTVSSKLVAGNYCFLLAVGGLDLSIATALITSSFVFLEKGRMKDNEVK